MPVWLVEVIVAAVAPPTTAAAPMPAGAAPATPAAPVPVAPEAPPAAVPAPAPVAPTTAPPIEPNAEVAAAGSWAAEIAVARVPAVPTVPKVPAPNATVPAALLDAIEPAVTLRYRGRHEVGAPDADRRLRRAHLPGVAAALAEQAADEAGAAFQQVEHRAIALGFPLVIAVVDDPEVGVLVQHDALAVCEAQDDLRARSGLDDPSRRDLLVLVHLLVADANAALEALDGARSQCVRRKKYQGGAQCKCEGAQAPGAVRNHLISLIANDLRP